MFSYISPEGLVPQDHPLRAIRPLVNAALERLSARFEQMYAPRGRDSIAPEKLLRALLLQALGTVQKLGDYAASAQCSPEPGAGSNSWPKPDPSAPL